jgi:AmiR/NasT family two-component response regulator
LDERVPTRSEREDEVEQLRAALASARHIGAAIGIVMAAHRCTEDEAFEMLACASMHQNRKLREVAGDVVRTGALP